MNNLKTWISSNCHDKTCTICGAQAEAIISEEILSDDPFPYRDKLSAFVCYHHFSQVLTGNNWQENITVNLPTFRLNDIVKLKRLHCKSPEGQKKINALLNIPIITVVGTRVVKRFPDLYDHQNNEYIQILTVNVKIDDQFIQVSASWLEHSS